MARKKTADKLSNCEVGVYIVATGEEIVGFLPPDEIFMKNWKDFYASFNLDATVTRIPGVISQWPRINERAV